MNKLRIVFKYLLRERILATMTVPIRASSSHGDAVTVVRSRGQAAKDALANHKWVNLASEV